MSSESFPWLRGPAGRLAAPLVPAVIGLALGALVMPALIYLAGTTALGQYEGGSLTRTYQGVLGGLHRGSVPSWIVVLGPYLLWQLWRLLRTWWRAAGDSTAMQ